MLCQQLTSVASGFSTALNGFAQKVFHCIGTASGSDRPNTQLLERNLILKTMGV